MLQPFSPCLRVSGSSRRVCHKPNLLGSHPSPWTRQRCHSIPFQHCITVHGNDSLGRPGMVIAPSMELVKGPTGNPWVSWEKHFVSSRCSLENPSTNPETPSLRNLYNLYSERRKINHDLTTPHMAVYWSKFETTLIKIVDYSNGSLTGKHVGGIKTCNLPLMMFDLSIHNSNANRDGQMSTGWCTSKCTRICMLKNAMPPTKMILNPRHRRRSSPFLLVDQLTISWPQGPGIRKTKALNGGYARLPAQP
jgi:hypothetical protein